MTSTDSTATMKAKLLTALEKSLGVVTRACKTAKCDRGTFYNYYNSDEAFKKSVDGLNEVAKDFIEDAAYRQVKAGDSSLIKYMLSTKCRDRGYSLTDSDSNDIIIRIIRE